MRRLQKLFSSRVSYILAVLDLYFNVFTCATLC